MSDGPKLVTRAEYDALPPKSQGYAQYMQGEWPGSELKRCRNPYRPGTAEYLEWESGQMLGVLEAQDSEE